jgi:hypothetical protein
MLKYPKQYDILPFWNKREDGPCVAIDPKKASPTTPISPKAPANRLHFQAAG